MKEKKKKPQKSIQELWYNRKQSNICVIRIPETEENGAEEIFEEIIVENFHKFIKDIQSHIQETQRTPRRINGPPPKKKTKPKTSCQTHHIQTAEK